MKTLAFQQQSEVFERVVRDARGRAFCVRFVVVEREGILRGRIISCTPIHSLRTTNTIRTYEQKYLLSDTKHIQTSSTPKIFHSKTTSPYFNKFQFLTAIKIRAPSFPN